MPKKIAPAFYFIGNHSVLDFVNTKIAVDGKPYELLETFTDVLDWLFKAELLTIEEKSLHEQQWGNGVEGELMVTEAKTLRSSLLAMLQSAMQGQPSREKDLEQVNRLLKSQVITARLVQHENRFTCERRVQIRKPADLLIPIAEAALDFFSRYDLQLVKKCENPECVLLFYDNSKNSTRRWCSQKTCGNRMKVAAYLERRKNQ